MSTALDDLPGVEPDVTLIIPVFDAMPYLRACLDSVLAQTIGLDRLEVVAVDDGSTDGSGEELEAYAAHHRDVITVIHQSNSGGPALPCNRGLELARGRYVFFLGADDHLGPQALERLVERADAWGSDVIFGRMKGVGGRFVDQRIFARTEPDLDFLTSPLAYALSNTKLFRRSLLEQHRIRYALDLRVGSDQPFVIEALTHARRVSVLADYTYYYAVRRTEATNITYATSWRDRLSDTTAVIEHITDLIAPGPVRDAILARHFGSELDKLLRRQFPDLAAADQAGILNGIQDLADRFWTPDLSDRLPAAARVRLQLARAGDLPRLERVVAYQRAVKRPPMVLRGDRTYVWSPILDESDEELEWHRVLLGDDVPDRLARSLHLDRLRLEPAAVRLRGRIGISPDHADRVSLHLTPIDGAPPGRQVGSPAVGKGRPVDLVAATDGAEFSVTVPLGPLVGSDSGRHRYAVRVRVEVPGDPVELPVRWSGSAWRSTLRHGLRSWNVEVKPSRARRIVLTLTPRARGPALIKALGRRARALLPARPTLQPKDR